MGIETQTMESTGVNLNAEDMALYEIARSSDPRLAALSKEDFSKIREVAKIDPIKAQEMRDEIMLLTPLQREGLQKARASNPAFKDLTAKGYLELRGIINKGTDLPEKEFVLSGDNVIMNEKPTEDELKEMNPKN